METPLVSICSITYNHAPFIRQCLDGFLMQQCNFPIEIIINDDCSTDGTTEIIREYAEKYPDKIFPIFHEENLYFQGVRGMFQKFVFPKARGKYIALCEGDDYWTDPLKLQKQVDFLESHPDYSMCFHKAEVVAESGAEAPAIYEGIEEREYFSEEILIFKPHIPTASCVMRRNVALNVPSHPDFIVGDILVFATAYVCGKVYGMNEVMSIYRRHLGGWTYGKESIDFLQNIVKHDVAMLQSYPRNVIKSRHYLTTHRFYTLFKEDLIRRKKISVLRYLPIIIRCCPFVLFKVVIDDFKRHITRLYNRLSK